MDGGISFIIITLGKLGIAFGAAIGFSSGFTWFHKQEQKTTKSGGGKRVYTDSDVRERLHHTPKQ